jgi:hypothetical protein
MKSFTQKKMEQLKAYTGGANPTPSEIIPLYLDDNSLSPHEFWIPDAYYVAS